MAKSKQKDLFIDVDLVIESYNEKNPTLRKMDRAELAKQLGVGKQSLSDWKNKKSPRWVYYLSKMMEIGEMELNGFLIERKDDDEVFNK